MSRTYLPRALEAGARLISDCRVPRLSLGEGRVSGGEAPRRGRRMRASTGDVFVCSGAVQPPALRDSPPLDPPGDARKLLASAGPSGFPAVGMNTGTVHVSSSCPMGENRAACPVDSRGRVQGLDNRYIGNASIILNAPGVNPRGTVMALALRNSRFFLEERGRYRAPGRNSLYTSSPVAGG